MIILGCSDRLPALQFSLIILTESELIEALRAKRENLTISPALRFGRQLFDVVRVNYVVSVKTNSVEARAAGEGFYYNFFGGVHVQD
eukprot:CAMPEP_0118635924 /NCGR_PEP_ID=MMETSP0785-20121206/2335_1 /TAXON_ID=91992 /ORGANISM="Bolidomonas pacifica, Strain CCMP 1866" /LENGTH=86 /DNA_ID=CAMNT_0006526989 /DNA_START=280 /DNA_END=540 /DNA_ORIENTATION=-